MNNLSLLIWFADIVNGLSHLFAWFGGGLLLCTAFAFYIAVIIHEGLSFDKRYLQRSLVISFFFLFIAVLLPSKQAVYAMTASEAAESLLATKTAKEIGNKSVAVVNKFLDEYLKEEEPVKKEQRTNTND